MYNGCLFADDIFKRIFFNENVWISITISLKFVPKVRINNIPALVHIMAWRQPGDQPLSEPMMVSWLTHICVTRPQWVNCSRYWSQHKLEIYVPNGRHSHVTDELTHWRLGDVDEILHFFLKIKWRIDILSTYCGISLRWVPCWPGNGLLSWGNKPLSEPMLTHPNLSRQCHHYTTKFHAFSL